MSIDTRVISQNGFAIRTLVDGTYADALMVDSSVLGLSKGIQIDQTSATSDSYPRILISNHNAVKGEAFAILSFQAGEYELCTPTDIGKMVIYGSGLLYDTGILVAFDNVTRVWHVQIEELNYFQYVDPFDPFVVVDLGQGQGLLSGPTTVSRSFNRSAIELIAGNGAISGYIQAEYEDIRITDDVISSTLDATVAGHQAGRAKAFPPYIDGQVRINTRGDYPLILGSDGSDFITISKNNVDIHNLGPVDLKISNHTETVAPAFLPAVTPIGAFTFQVNTAQDYGQGPREFANINVELKNDEIVPDYYGRINFTPNNTVDQLDQLGFFTDATSDWYIPSSFTKIYATDNPAMSLIRNMNEFITPLQNAGDIVFQNYVGMGIRDPQRALHIDQSSFLGDNGRFPSLLVNNSNEDKGVAVAILSFPSNDYTSAIPAFIGQIVLSTSSYSNGVLLSYNNTVRQWKVQIEELDYFKVIETVTVTDGFNFGGGSLVAPAIIQRPFNRANAEVSAGNAAIGGFMQAEYEDINLTDDVTTPIFISSDYTNGQVRINTRGDYPLILGSDESDMVTMSRENFDIHQHQHVNFAITRHAFSDVLPDSFPLGKINFTGPGGFGYAAPPLQYAQISNTVLEQFSGRAKIEFTVVEFDENKPEGIADSSAALTISAGSFLPNTYVQIRGKLGIDTTAPTSPLHVVGLPSYASNAAAGTAGLVGGSFYTDSNNPSHVCVYD